MDFRIPRYTRYFHAISTLSTIKLPPGGRLDYTQHHISSASTVHPLFALVPLAYLMFRKPQSRPPISTFPYSPSAVWTRLDTFGHNNFFVRVVGVVRGFKTSDTLGYIRVVRIVRGLSNSFAIFASLRGKSDSSFTEMPRTLPKNAKSKMITA